MKQTYIMLVISHKTEGGIPIFFWIIDLHAENPLLSPAKISAPIPDSRPPFFQAGIMTET